MRAKARLLSPDYPSSVCTYLILLVAVMTILVALVTGSAWITNDVRVPHSGDIFLISCALTVVLYIASLTSDYYDERRAHKRRYETRSAFLVLPH